MNIEQKINKLEQELSELKQQTKNCMPKYWDFKIGEKFYYIDIAEVYSSEYVDSNFEKDLSLSGNIFRTKEEAEKARDIALAKQRVAYAIEVLNDGWKPDWSIGNGDYKYFIYNNNANKLEVSWVSYWKQQPNYMYCKTIEIAEQIRQEHEEDLFLIFSE